jgi:hypothetical protein
MKMLKNSMNSFLLSARRSTNKNMKNFLGTIKKSFSEERREPMLKLNYQTYIKNRKIVEDLLKVNDISDFKWTAAIIQSDMFHEFLFQALSKINF